MPRILVVDDEPDVRNTLKGILEDAGYQVQIAGNERDAMAAVVREPFDFALMDVRLHEDGEGDESGLSLAMAFRGLNPKGKIIILSGYTIPSATLRAVRYLGVVDYIGKGVVDWVDLILKTLKEALDEPKQRNFHQNNDSTHLHISLAVKQPPVIRAHGHHTYSMYSQKLLDVDFESYALKTELARQNPDSLSFQVKDIGIDLWKDVFDQHLNAANTYLEARAKSNPLSLVFEAPAEFLRLPLEFLRPNKSSVPLVLQHPLTRFISGVTVDRDVISPSLLALTRKLSILIIASNTKPRIDGVDEEAKAIYNYIKNEQAYIPVDVKLVETERATYDHVKQELKKPIYDIIHYAGHGYYDPSSPDKSSLYFWSKENRQGNVVPMNATDLTLSLKQSKERMVYLSCCFGTTTGNKTALLRDDFLGLADAVVQAGIPSVLGYRWPVADQRAQHMALSFYESLLEQGSPEIALWRARCDLASANKDEPTWLSPILICQE